MLQEHSNQFVNLSTCFYGPCLLSDKAIAANILSYPMRLFERERTSAETILCALYLYFLGLSKFQKHSKAVQLLERGRGMKSHISIGK